MVMKVINNRVRNANEDRARQGRIQNINALDVALDPWQFSMYNAGEPGWKRAIQPGYNVNLNHMVKAYMKFNHSKFRQTLKSITFIITMRTIYFHLIPLGEEALGPIIRIGNLRYP